MQNSRWLLKASRNRRILLGTVAIVWALTAHADPEQAADAASASPTAVDAEIGGLDAVVDETQIRGATQRSDPPLTTRFSLNGQTLDAESNATARFGLLYGEHRRNEPAANLLIPLETDVDAFVENGVGVRRQSGWYGQLQMVDRTRTVRWRRQVPVELIGFDLDLSVTGGCLAPGTAADALCTFTPGMTVGEDDLDPDTLTPGRFRFDSEFGDQIDPATHQALKDAPDFVRGDPELDERVGISLEVPNAGQILDESRRSLSGINRTERTVRRPMFTLSHVEQTVRSSDREASLERTTRGFVLLEGGEWDRYSIGAQLGAWLLPGFSGQLPQGDGGPPRGDISNNLFLASNNLRVPRDSFTMFQTGVGHVDHPDTAPQTPDDTPAVFYNSIWLGVSPMRTVERSTTTSRVRTTGPREFQQTRYSQGGIGTPFEDIVGRITIIDEIANDINSLELQNIDDIFVQAGLGVSRQQALEELVTEQRSSFRYVPHLSFTGNRTDGRSVIRYYTGVINPKHANFYLGADMTRQSDNGVRVSASVIGYTRPDPDYYSNAEVSIARSFATGDGNAMTVGVSGGMEFDRPSLIAESPTSRDQDDGLELFGQYQADWGRLTGRLRASNLRNGGTTHSATIGATLPVFERSQMSVQVTPVSNEDAFVQARVGMAVPLTERSGGPVLRAQYARLKYNFGNDAFGQGQSVTEDTVRASLQFEF